MSNDEFTMTAYERKSLALLERIAVAVERIVKEDYGDDDDVDPDEVIASQTNPMQGAFTFTPWANTTGSSITSDITKAIKSIQMTGSAYVNRPVPNEVQKAYVDKLNEGRKTDG